MNGSVQRFRWVPAVLACKIESALRQDQTLVIDVVVDPSLFAPNNTGC